MTDKLHHLVVFNIDGQALALRLNLVERVERAVEITRLPQMPENVLGIVSLKGQIVPVFSLRQRFRLPERDVDPRDQLIFARSRRRLVALLVDSVGEVRQLAASAVTANDDVLPGLQSVQGVARIDGSLALIHDLDRFLSLEEEAVLAEAMQSND